MSRAIEILTAIRNSGSYTDIAQSRIEAILKSILDNTTYSENAQSRYEELLLAIKDETTTTLVAQSRLEELLIAIANGTLNTYLIGKNFFNGAWETGSISATTGNDIISTSKLRCGIVDVIPSNTYTFALNQSSNVFGVYNIHAIDKNGNWLGARAYFNLESLGTSTTSFTFTCPSDVYGIRLVLTPYGNDGGTIDINDLSKCKMMLNVGSSASDYSTYEFTELEESYINASM